MDDFERVQVGDALEELADEALHLAHGEGDVLDEREEVVFHVLEDEERGAAVAVHGVRCVSRAHLSS